MEITKEQLAKILVLDPNFFKKELEVGKWYKLDRLGKFMFYYDGKYSDDKNKLFGFNLKGEWSNSLEFHIGDETTLATNQEVKDALIIEAKKRYKTGDLVYDLSFAKTKSSLNIQRDIMHYYPETDYMFFNGLKMYEKGKWAEIIETITKEEAEKILNKIII